LPLFASHQCSPKCPDYLSIARAKKGKYSVLGKLKGLTMPRKEITIEYTKDS